MTRGRKPAAHQPALPDTLNREVLAEANAASIEQSARSMEIAERYGDGTPYERLRVISEARFYLGQSAEAMLEAGKRLIQIKENEPHGEFIEIIETLGIPARTAQSLMNAVVKYLSPRLQGKSGALVQLGRTKLLDLVTVDDDELAELAEGGTLAGHSIDEIEAMSTRELRAALRERDAAIAAKDKLIAKKDGKLNELAEAEERRRNGTPDEREVAQMDELRDVGLGMELALLRMVATVDAVMSTPATESAEIAARQTLDYVVQRVADACAARGLSAEILGERVEPGWMRPIKEAVEGGLAAREQRLAANKQKRGH